MNWNKLKLYIYLANRNKKGVRILAVWPGQPCQAVRVKEIDKLGLPKSLEQKITQETYEQRMRWELWIEAAENYKEFKQSLKNRGYSQYPSSAIPKFSLDNDTKKAEIKINSPPSATMVRRKY